MSHDGLSQPSLLTEAALALHNRTLQRAKSVESAFALSSLPSPHATMAGVPDDRSSSGAASPPPTWCLEPQRHTFEEQETIENQGTISARFKETPNVLESTHSTDNWSFNSTYSENRKTPSINRPNVISDGTSTLSSMFTPSKRRVFTPPQFRYKGSTAERPLKEQQQSHHEIASYSSDTSRLTRNADVDKPNIYTHDKSPIPSSSIFSNFSDIIPSKVKENGNMPNGSSNTAFRVSKRYRTANGSILSVETHDAEPFATRSTTAAEEKHYADFSIKKTLDEIKKYGLSEIPSFDSLKRSPIAQHKQFSLSERISSTNGSTASTVAAQRRHSPPGEVLQNRAENLDVRRYGIVNNEKERQQQQTLIDHDLNRPVNTLVPRTTKPDTKPTHDEDVFKQPAAVGSTLHAERRQLQQNLKDQEAWAEKENVKDRAKEDAIRNSAPVIPGKEVLKLNGSHYTILGEIGRGGTSRVYRVVCHELSDVFALKRISLENAEDHAIQGYVNEIKLLRRLRGHEHIVRLYDYEIDQSSRRIQLILELGQIDLAHLMARQKLGPTNMHYIRVYWAQMLQAVEKIHEEKIVHSDLKPANFILVNGALKLIDFGIAKAIANDTTNIHREQQVGTINYMSPEAIIQDSSQLNGKGSIKLGRPSDVWSLGCILYQMVYGKPPFHHLNLWQKLAAIPDPGHRIDFPSTISRVSGKPSSTDSHTTQMVLEQDLLDVMQSCLQRDPKKRMTIPQLLEHPFLRPKQVSLINETASFEEMLQLAYEAGKSGRSWKDDPVLKRTLKELKSRTAQSHLNIT